MWYFVDPCLALSCEHMCINIQSGPKCECSEGFQLNEDATSCTGNRHFVLIIENYDVWFTFELICYDSYQRVWNKKFWSDDFLIAFNNWFKQDED